MKAVVIYYSWGGNTKSIAEKVARELNCGAARIDTVVPYEGDYNSIVDRGADEVKRGYEPEIKPLGIDLSDYDTVILGTPVWWYTFAPAVKTFLSPFYALPVIHSREHIKWKHDILKYIQRVE